MAQQLRCCNGTYTRDPDCWRYPWGDPVHGATDLALGDLIVLDDDLQGVEQVDAFRPLTDAERRWLEGDATAIDEIVFRRRNGHRPDIGDLIIGMQAPELHALTMLTVVDIAEAAGVSKATIDSYRYRGYLPEPQVVRGRTPMWARPIVRHWLESRPGAGWRTDIYRDDPQRGQATGATA